MKKLKPWVILWQGSDRLYWHIQVPTYRTKAQAVKAARRAARKSEGYLDYAIARIGMVIYGKHTGPESD